MSSSLGKASLTEWNKLSELSRASELEAFDEKRARNNAFNKSTRFTQNERAKKARAGVLKLREPIPRVLGPNTYIYAAIAANGGVLRQTDIMLSLGASAARIENYNAQYGNLLRTFQLQTKQGRGPRGLAIVLSGYFHWNPQDQRKRLLRQRPRLERNEGRQSSGVAHS